MLYRPNTNRVIIKPDPHLEEFKNRTVIPWHGSMQRHFNVYGEVVAVPDNLFFQAVPDEILDGPEKEEFAQYHNASGNWDTSIEIKPGDRVAFRYSAHFFGQKFGDGLLAIPYDLLAIRMNDNYPLNGYVIFKIPYKEERFIVNSSDSNDYGKGELIEQGEMVGYMNGEQDQMLVKKHFLYQRKSAMRLELDIHNTLLVDNQSSVFIIHRDKIACTWD